MTHAAVGLLCTESSSDVLALAMEVLACLGNSQVGKKNLVAADTVETVVPLLCHSTGAVNAMATRCLLMASGCLEGKQRLGQVQQAAENLKERALDERIDVAISAIYTVENAGEWPNTRDTFR